MEIKEKDILSLKREIEEKKKNRRLSGIFKEKVKLNFALEEEKFFDNLVKAYVKILSSVFVDENRIEKIKELVETDTIKLDFEYVNKYEQSFIDVLKILHEYNYTKATRPKFYNDLNWINIYKVTVTDGTNNIEFYTSFDIPISKKLRSMQYILGYDRVYNVFDVREFIAELLINKECHNYLKYNRDSVVFSVINTILERGIASRPKELKPMYENRLYNAVDIEMLKRFYIESLDLKTTKYSTEEFYKLMHLLEVLENKNLNLYETLADIYTHKHYLVSTLEKHGFSFNFYSLPLRNITICKVIFKEMSKDYDQIKLYEQYSQEDISDYAKSYETKKNIPLKTQEAMKSSKFLKHFSYVEYDAETNLSDMFKIETEFDKIADYLGLKYIPNVRNDRNIRFRKLGKYKAGGLYFPFYNCVCVDLDSPSSLLHEVSHMIDKTYMKGINLHELFQFRIIAKKYISEMDRYIDSLEECHPIRTQYYNKNVKYNRDYYTYYPEIFARCSEIYLKRILNLNTNLLGDCEGFAYPKNKELEKMIKDFFESKVFTKVGYVEEKISVVATSNNSKEKKINYISKNTL